MTCKFITAEEWAEKKFPFSFIKVKNDVWRQFHRDIIQKWIEEHCGKGWVYFDGHDTYCFESPGDQILFSVWIKSDPFDQTEGEYK